MILLLCIVLGLLLRVAAGRPVSQLGELRLRGEGALLALLLIQAVMPLMELTGTAAELAFWVWLSTFLLLLGVAWVNRRQAGMAVLGAGLGMNALVIALNQGMPVSVEAARFLGATSVSQNIPSGDFVHVILSASTRLAWLADVIPLPGPAWLQSVVSPGDCLLFMGVVACVAFADGRVASDVTF